MRRARKLGLVALGAGLVLITAVGVGYALDGRAPTDRVNRNVALAGVSLSGKTADEVRQAVDVFARAYPSTPVNLRDEGTGVTTTAQQLGLSVDVAATTRAALTVGRHGSLPDRIVGWLGSFLHARRVPVQVSVREPVAWEAIRRLDPRPGVAPIEPGIALHNGSFVAVKGKDGTGIDPVRVMRSLAHAAERGGRVDVRVVRGAVPPRFSMQRARRLAEEADAATARGLSVQANGVTATAPVATVRRWVTSQVGADDLQLAVDATKVAPDLPGLLSAAATPPVDAGFTVSPTGEIAVTPSKTGTVCCTMPAAAQRIERALLSRSTDPVALTLAVQQPHRSDDDARRLGVVEPVAVFTTKHACCAPRVTNIHLMADAVRGAVIEPGKVFSINDRVGKRTATKGYVNAPVIYDGKEDEDIGGGVSQFATTLFNASFFAGLDFLEYQSHTLYISRYPYGREATMGFPHPDLKVKNTTPYGVLIWPTYDGTSLTVTLYSTKYLADVQQTKQTASPKGSCTQVTTERTRTYLDGTTKVDTVRALYQAAEGILCNQAVPAGTPTSRPRVAVTTTTTRPATTTTRPAATSTAKTTTTTRRPVTTTTTVRSSATSSTTGAP